VSGGYDSLRPRTGKMSNRSDSKMRAKHDGRNYNEMIWGEGGGRGGMKAHKSKDGTSEIGSLPMINSRRHFK
jgi:hypothetical protein